MRIIQALSLTIALLVPAPVAVLAAPGLGERCSDRIAATRAAHA